MIKMKIYFSKELHLPRQFVFQRKRHSGRSLPIAEVNSEGTKFLQNSFGAAGEIEDLALRSCLL